MQRFCLALDLVNDAALIAEYESYHQHVWPEIKKVLPMPVLPIWKSTVLKTDCS